MVKERICVSCKKQVANDKNSCTFKCPNCKEFEITRCGNCRANATKYKCPNCDFEGPN